MSTIIPEQPDDELRRKLERFVYVIEFASGIVKVGQTRNPKNRLAQHKTTARQYGTDVAKVWVSPPHTGFDINEQALIRFCADRGKPSGGGEYYAGLDFYVVAAFAESLPFKPLTTGELAERSKQAGPTARELRAAQLDRFERLHPPRDAASLTEEEKAQIAASFGGNLLFPRPGGAE